MWVCEGSQVAEPEKQMTESFEALTQDFEEPVNEPPPSVDATILEQMDAELNTVASHDPPCPKSPSPPRPSGEILFEKNPDDVTITGMAYTAPGISTVLAKHNTKEEYPSLEKGKTKLDLESYAALSASDIHAGYLNRLHTSRDFEAGLVNLMKELYEVCY